MPFPISYNSETSLSDAFSFTHFRNDFFEAVSDKLADNAFDTSVKDENTLVFQGGIFRFAWNGFRFLNGITKGRIQLIHDENRIRVRYRLMFHEVVALAALFTIIPLFFYFMASYSMGIIILVWGVFAGGNYLLASLRFKAFIHRTLKDTQQQGPSTDAVG